MAIFDNVEYSFIEDVAKNFHSQHTFSYGWIPFYRWESYKVYLLYRELSKQGEYRRILIAFYREGEITPSISANFATNGFEIGIRGTEDNPIIQIRCNNELGIYESMTEYMYDTIHDRCYSLCDNKVMYRYTTEECIRIFATEGIAYNEPFNMFYDELYLSTATEDNKNLYNFIDRLDDNIPFSNNRKNR